MELLVIILIALLVALPAGIIIGISLESSHYNHGYCPHCNEKLRHFDTDSQGGRGYICNKCSYSTWVSYNCVDKYHSEV